MTSNPSDRQLRRHVRLHESVFDLTQLPRSITPASVDTIDLKSQIRDPDTTGSRRLLLEAYLTRSELSASVRHVRQLGLDQESVEELMFRHGLYLGVFMSEMQSALDVRLLSERSVEGYAIERAHFERQQQDILQAAATIVRMSTTFPIYELKITYRRL